MGVVGYLLDAGHLGLNVLIVPASLRDEFFLLQHLFLQLLNQLRLVVDLLILKHSQYSTISHNHSIIM
jgi:hypothetical protein